MANYSIDTDLTTYEPNIMSMGDTTIYAPVHADAKRVIDNKVLTDWWKQLEGWGYNSYTSGSGDRQFITWTPAYLFDTTKLEQTQFKNLSALYVLRGIYAMNSGLNIETMNPKVNYYSKLYQTEWEALMARGITYDWSGDGTFTYLEKYMAVNANRRVMRG